MTRNSDGDIEQYDFYDTDLEICTSNRFNMESIKFSESKKFLCPTAGVVDNL